MANEIFGTEFDDSGATALHGTMGDDIIFGLEGNDEIFGGSGINIYIGGAGDDDFFGATFGNSENHDIADYSDADGPIYVFLATENGYVSGDLSVGNDTLSYIDRIVGTAFNDVFDVGNTDGIQAHIEGGAGDDEINGNQWNTVVRYTSAAAGVTVDLQAGTAYSTAPEDAAGIGVDTLNYISEVRGSDHADNLSGSDTFSLETFRGRGGADTIDGRGGWDEADYSNAASGVTVNLGLNGNGNGVASNDGDGSSDILLNIEDVSGSVHDDDITGDDMENEVFGNMGNDVIRGLGGEDELIGGEGNDHLIGGAGNDGLEGGEGDDTLEGGTGINFLGGGSGIDTGVFDGNRADYGVFQQLNSPFAELVLIDTRTGLPEDTIHFTSSIENFSFADGTLDVASLGSEFNYTPEAASEFFTVRPGDIVTYNILSNDFDADGDPLMLVDLGNWNWNGTQTPITWDEAGNITFVVPDMAPFGNSIVFYANVWDGKGGLAESTVTFQYTETPNSPPTANPDIYPTPATDNLLFLGFTAESGPEFYKLGNDGTLNQVTSSGLNGGLSQAEPYLFGDALYFTAVDPVTGKEQVWRGIDGEIELVTRLNNAGNGITVENFVEFDGGLYFYAAQKPSDNPSGFSGGIFRIDETGAVSQITDPAAGDPNFFYQPVILGGNLVFGGGTQTSGPQWWSIDGSGNIAQLSPGVAANSGFPVSGAQIVFNGELYWHENNLITGTNDLLKIDATGSVSTIATFDAQSFVTEFKAFGGNLYFHVNDEDPAVDGSHSGIYKISGGAVQQLTTEPAGEFVGFFFPTEINGTLYYGAYDPVTFDEAWYSISGPAGETVTEIAAGPWPKVVGTGDAILLHEDKIYWNAFDEFGNAQVWVFDPLVGFDVLVSDINSSNGGIVVDRFYSFDGELYFGSTTGGAAGIYKISDAGVVTQVVDSSQVGQPTGFFFPMPIGPDEAVVEYQYVMLDVLANDTDPDNQIDHGQSLQLVDVEITSIDGPYGVALGTGTASIVDNKLFFNQGSDFAGLATGQTATVTIAYTVRDTGGYEDTSYAQITITGGGVSATPIVGTPDGETIPGTPSDDAILADAGDDTIVGNGGNDFIDGGEGTDTAVFARTFFDGNGYSVFLNDNGTVRVDAEGTTIDDGSVTLTNVEFLDFGGTIYNLITGDENDNTIGGTGQNDLILGGDGDDTIEGGADNDLMGGGAGWGDTLSYASSTAGVTVNLSTGTASGSETGNDVFGEFEHIIGGAGGDTLIGDDWDNFITGGGGNDTIDGGDDPFDVAIYSGVRADYLVTAGAPGWIVIEDLRDGSPDGTDTVTNVEFFDFNGQSFYIGDLIDLGGELQANADEGSAGENEYKLFNVLANDSAPSGAALTLSGYTVTSVTSDNFAIDGISVDGILSTVANQIEFNPGALFDQLTGTQSATITLQYTVADGLGGFATAPLVITVDGENDAPVAGNTSAFGGEDDVFIHANLPVFDADHPFDPATIEIVSQTGPGIASPWSGGGIFAIDFQAAGFYDALAEGEEDVVTLTYRVIDAGGGVSNDAEITITIFGANDLAIAEDDYATAVAGVASTIDVLANDYDVDTNDTLTIVNAFSPNATIVIENGLLTYTANAGFSGEDMISYTIDDGSGSFNFANVFVTVEGGNQDPIAVADDVTVGENQQITIDVLANDSDPDAGDVLTLLGASVLVSSGNPDINNIDATGAFATVGNQYVFSPGTLFDALGEGQTATITVDYLVTDNNGGTATAPLIITVNGENDAPIAQNAVGFGTEDGPVIAQLAVTDVDDPFNMGGTVEIVSSSGTGGISVLPTPGGYNLVYDAQGNHDYLAVGESEEVSVTYRVTDTFGGVSNEATVFLAIHGQNDMPVAVADEADAVAGTPVEIDVLANDTDPDTNDILTVISATAANGMVAIGENGVISYIANLGFTGADTIFYQIADGNGGFSDGTVTVNVTSDNAPPTVADVSLTVLENQGNSTGLLGSDENIPMLNFNLVAPLAGAHIAGNVINFFAGPEFDYLAAGQTAEIILQYTATDIEGLTSDPANITITVVGQNDMPLLAPIVMPVVNENTATAFLTLQGTDLDTSDVLTYAIAGGVDAAFFTIDAATGALAFATPPDFEAFADSDGDNIYIVDVSVSDGIDTSAATIFAQVADVAGLNLSGTSGDDTLDGTIENDTLSGLAGNDILTGFAGNDVISGHGGDDTLDGGDGDDILVGGLGADIMLGGSGNDVIRIGATEAIGETIDGGDGIDTIEVTGSGAVRLTDFNAIASSVEQWVGNGAGITGGSENNTFNLAGLSGAETIGLVDGGAGDDVITGTSFDDDLRGGIGDDQIAGGAGNDTISGGTGADTTSGGEGDDTFVIAGTEAANDTFDGGDGTDTVSVTGAGNATLSNFDAAASSIEVWSGNDAGIYGTATDDRIDISGLTAVTGLTFVEGSSGNDEIIGSMFADDLRGGAGDDQLTGGSGNDTITGGTGADTSSGGEGDDTFVISGTDAAADTIDGGEGTDNISVSGATNVTLGSFDAAASSIEVWNGNNAGIFGTVANDRINLSGLTAVAGLAFVDGSSGNDEITGSMFADDLRGGAGDDTLIGGGGDDTLIGNAGADAMQGGDGNDRFVVAGSDALFDTFDGGDGIDSVDVTGTAALRLTSIDTAASSIEVWNGNGAGILGSSGSDTLDFSGVTIAANNMGAINGGVGDDILIGSSFDDVLIGASQNDTLIGGAGNDVLQGGAGIDIVFGGAGNDTIIVERTFELSDILDGGEGDGDVLLVAGTLNLYLKDFDTTTNGFEIWQGNNAALLGAGAINTFNLSGLTAVSGLSYVDGASGNDTLIGSVFGDDLRGGAGTDQIFGGDGADRLNGGTGNDVLTGGAGSDIFEFNASWGRDQILDFDSADQLFFTGIAGLDEFADLTQSIVSGNVQIAFGTNTIALVGHTNFLTADDFSFT
jgi:Ca2+-binding RTX toxin-like protein